MENLPFSVTYTAVSKTLFNLLTRVIRGIRISATLKTRIPETSRLGGLYATTAISSNVGGRAGSAPGVITSEVKGLARKKTMSANYRGTLSKRDFKSLSADQILCVVSI